MSTSLVILSLMEEQAAAINTDTSIGVTANGLPHIWMVMVCFHLEKHNFKSEYSYIVATIDRVHHQMFSGNGCEKEIFMTTETVNLCGVAVWRSGRPYEV